MKASRRISSKPRKDLLDMPSYYMEKNGETFKDFVQRKKGASYTIGG